MKKSEIDYSARIKKRFPDFEKEWMKLIHEIGIDLVNFLREKINVESMFLKELSSFKFRLIVDNNFVLGQIKGAIKRNEAIEKSLLYKLLISKSIEIFAPPLLEKELHEKINEVMDQNEQALALNYALILMPKIVIKDAQWVVDWKKANNLIGEFDPDDVSYLALAFEIGGHAIISFDDVFHKQGDVQVWQHKETDRVITNYNSGFISITLMGGIGDLLSKLLAVLFRFIRDAILKLVKLLTQLAQGIVVGLSKIPPAILLVLLSLGIIFWEDIKKAGKDLAKFLVEKGNEIIAKLRVAIKDISEMISKVLDIAKLGATITFEFLGFLLAEYNGLNEQIEKLKFADTKNTHLKS